MFSVHLLVENKRKEILLVQRNDVPFWVIPGGHSNSGENFSQTASREFYEETGLKAKNISLIAIYHNRLNYQKYLFKGQVLKGKLKTGKETRDIKWFNPTKLPTPISLYEKARVSDFINYKTRVIKRKDEVDLLKEIFNQFRNPLIFVNLLFLYFINNIFGSRSFRLRV